MKQRLIIIRGLPGSGKSTLAKELSVSYLNMTSAHYEADQYFMNNGIYEFDAKRLHIAHKNCLNNTKTALETGINTVIVSNTFTTIKELKPYFKLANDFKIKPIVIHCQNNFGSVHDVPEEKMLEMRTRFCYDISELFN